MKWKWIAAVGLAGLLVTTAFAKRGEPLVVAPIRSGDIEYRAPTNQMGSVEAWDTKRNLLIWRRQIYVVKYDTQLETDVQDVFINAIKLTPKTLKIVNERKSEYDLDLGTLQVVVVKGSLVETLK